MEKKFFLYGKLKTKSMKKNKRKTKNSSYLKVSIHFSYADFIGLNEIFYKRFLFHLKSSFNLKDIHSISECFLPSC